MEGSFLKLPLEAAEGALRGCSRAEAVRQLLGAMAVTPSGAWWGGERFGLSDLLEECSRVQQAESHQMKKVVMEAEAVLADFGFPGCRLVPNKGAVSRYGSLEFEFVLNWPGGEAEPLTLTLFR